MTKPAPLTPADIERLAAPQYPGQPVMHGMPPELVAAARRAAAPLLAAAFDAYEDSLERLADLFPHSDNPADNAPTPPSGAVGREAIHGIGASRLSSAAALPPEPQAAPANRRRAGSTKRTAAARPAAGGVN